jgi:hypothetical protein
MSGTNWLMNAGTLYYLTIQTSTINGPIAGGRCNVLVPCGTDYTLSANYGVVTQQGPCDNTWSTLSETDGGYLHMSISGIPLSMTPTVTPSATPVKPADASVSSTTYLSLTATVTSSGTPTPSVWRFQVTDSDTSSASSSPSATSTISLIPMTNSNTPTVAPLPSISVSATYSKSPFNSSNGALGANIGKEPTVSSGPIIGGAVFGVIVVLLASALLAYNVNNGFRNTFGIKAVRSPVSSQSVITMNPVNNPDTNYN